MPKLITLEDGSTITTGCKNSKGEEFASFESACASLDFNTMCRGDILRAVKFLMSEHKITDKDLSHVKIKAADVTEWEV